MPYFESGGLQIFYRIQGEGSPVLLIHGLGSSSRDWEIQVSHFSQLFKVITVDLRGHGRSDKPPGPYSMFTFAGDCASLLDGLDSCPAHVVGISLGGMVAFQLAVDFPDLVRKLVVVNSVADLVPSSVHDLVSYWQRLLIVRLWGMEKMGQVLADRFFTEPDQEPLKEVFVKRWSENHKPSYRASLKSAFGWSVRHRLGEIKAPTLVIAADGDYFPLEEKEADTALIPEARLVVVNHSKHALPAEKPEEFNRLVEQFLKS